MHTLGKKENASPRQLTENEFSASPLYNLEKKLVLAVVRHTY